MDSEAQRTLNHYLEDRLSRWELGDFSDPLRSTLHEGKAILLPCQYHGDSEPAYGFVRVPTGPFVMGEDERQMDIPYHYWITRYSVTVAQYGCFVDAAGYDQPDHWTETG